MITTMPTTLNILFALFLPATVNSIEPAVDAKTMNDIDDVFLRKVGKYDEKIFTFSSCEAEGFEENVLIHNITIKIGMSRRTSPTIDIALWV
jgi:hypothetical protein